MDFDLLIQQPESARNEAWEQRFLEEFPSLKVQVVSDQAKSGPDGWPYLSIRTGAAGTEPTRNIMAWLATKGIGLVVNDHKMMPDYVFTYGMLWNFHATGRFMPPPPPPRAQVSHDRETGEVCYNPGQGLIMGPPAETYLPQYVRKVLREFLHTQSFAEPKILVVSNRDFSQIDLLFSLESLGGLVEAKDQKAFAEMMAWFLPLHYNLVLASGKGLPAFVDL